MRHNRFLEAFEGLLEGLNQEREETREMLKTFFQALTQYLPRGETPSQQQIHDALEQLKDVHRMAALLLVAILPGSVVTLPALCALGRRFGIEFLPDGFRDR